jgi:probable F420-dependent oxidoreductase
VLDPLALLGYVAALTTRVRLGTSVLISPVYDPILLARALAALDQISDGRLIVGIGLGTAQRLYPRYGISTAGAVGRFVEGLQLMNALWTSSSTTFEGRYWHADQVVMEPKPVQKPRPPVWFGGGHPNALRRAVRHADGWMGAGISSTRTFVENSRLLRRYLEEADRDPTTFQIAKRIYVGLDSDGARGKRRTKEWLGRVYSGFSIDEGTIVSGDVRECTDRIAEVTAETPDLLLLHPMFDETEQIEALAQEVIPAL